ncbi:MAG: AbrB/MazE/SpoVT family DNA-binding domain-containing protein [Nodosilinea sp.]
MTIVSIDAAGRVEISAAIRKQLGLYPLKTLQLEVSEGRIILYPPVQMPEFHREGTALVVETPPLGNPEDINAFIDTLREDRIQSQIP